jgi:hypothetical protein
MTQTSTHAHALSFFEKIHDAMHCASWVLRVLLQTVPAGVATLHTGTCKLQKAFLRADAPMPARAAFCNPGLGEKGHAIHVAANQWD